RRGLAERGLRRRRCRASGPARRRGVFAGAVKVPSSGAGFPARRAPTALRGPCRAAIRPRAPVLRRAAPAASAPPSGGCARRTPRPAPRWAPCPCRPRAAGSSLHLDTRSVGPEPFQIVVGPLLAVEDVHHHVAEVEQHPAAPA